MKSEKRGNSGQDWQDMVHSLYDLPPQDKSPDESSNSDSNSPAQGVAEEEGKNG